MKLTTAAELASGMALFVGVMLSTRPDYTERFGQIPDLILDVAFVVAVASLSIDIMARRRKRPRND